MREYKIIAYLADWGHWEVSEIRGEMLTHLNYAFATIEDGKVVARVVGQELKNIHKLRELKAKYPHLKTLISIGGWGADGFSDAALTHDSRKLFSETAIDFMKRHDFDGIDVDWEYPCSDAAGIVARPEDKEHFTLMLKDLRERLSEQGKKDGRKYLLTIAVGAGRYFIEGTQMHLVHKYLDFINVMTYDMSAGRATTGHHTNLYASKLAPGISAKESVQMFAAQGIPKKNLVLGAAFYGRIWGGVRNVNNGLGQPGSQPSRRINTIFSNIHENLVDKGGFVRYWDDDAKAPYLYDGDIFITYDDEMSIKHKTDYIKREGLAGIMFWEYCGDKPGRLLKVMGDNLK